MNGDIIHGLGGELIDPHVTPVRLGAKMIQRRSPQFDGDGGDDWSAAMSAMAGVSSSAR